MRSRLEIDPRLLLFLFVCFVLFFVVVGFKTCFYVSDVHRQTDRQTDRQTTVDFLRV